AGIHWPVYPEIAERLGFKGSYDFETAAIGKKPRETIQLEAFVERSFAIFDKVKPEPSEFTIFKSAAYRWLSNQTNGKKRASATTPRSTNPYTGLPDRQVWRQSIERIEPQAVDPVQGAPFKLDRKTKIATAGSCFAQHISRTLAARGFNYLIAEQAPE